MTTWEEWENEYPIDVICHEPKKHLGVFASRYAANRMAEDLELETDVRLNVIYFDGQYYIVDRSFN